MSWQPIDTAPKQAGVEVLVYVPDFGVNIGRWDPDSFETKRGASRPYWHWSYIHGRIRQRLSQPTHWMPLPKKPAGAR